MLGKPRGLQPGAQRTATATRPPTAQDGRCGQLEGRPPSLGLLYCESGLSSGDFSGQSLGTARVEDIAAWRRRVGTHSAWTRLLPAPPQALQVTEVLPVAVRPSRVPVAGPYPAVARAWRPPIRVVLGRVKPLSGGDLSAPCWGDPGHLSSGSQTLGSPVGGHGSGCYRRGHPSLPAHMFTAPG